jgi:uncharacterized membrane protein YccC
MLHRHFSLTQKSLLYSAKTLLGACLCWYGLTAFGVDNPIWSVITVIIVSDADLSTTATLAKVRVINTAVGCASGLISMLLFGYTPLVCLLTAAVTVLFVTSLQRYPANWRLAPVTVVILMNAGSQAVGKEAEVILALLRAVEIGVGSAVALLLAHFFSQVAHRGHHPAHEGE